MRSTITRTLTQSTIRVAKIEFNGDTPVATPLEPVIVYGNVSKEDAKREVAKVYGKDNSIVVAKIESEEKFFEISVSDFIKYAKVVDKNADETENENQKAEVK